MSKNKDNYIDLSKLPRKNNKIQWKEAIGYSCYFSYEGIKGHVLIIKMCEDHKKIIVNYNNIENEILIDSFRNCKLAYVVGLKFKDYIYNIGDKVVTPFGEITITNQIRKHNHRYYECVCEHGHLFQKSEFRMDSCPYCSGRNAIKGETDIKTTNPEMFKMLANNEYGYTHKQNSSIKTDWICPDCGNLILDKSPNQVYTYGLGCNSCSDGVSYGEKFIYNLMKYLNVNIKTQYTKTDANWCKDYKYDMYLYDYNCIIECHGLQHYEENTNFKMSLEEVQENDINKEVLAKKYVDNYIVIDCKQSKLSYIKESIKKSILLELLNFHIDDVDWKLIHQLSLKSNVKRACELWESGMLIKNIAEEIKVNKDTVTDYLKKGSEIGFCNYSVEKSKEYTTSNLKKINNQNLSKPIMCNENKMVFQSANLCSKISKNIFDVNINRQNIQKVLNNERSHTRNFTFQYITREEFNKIKSESPELAFGDYFNV